MLETRQLILRDLADRRVIAEDDIACAHRHAANKQMTVIQALIDTGRVSNRDLALARARVSEHPFVDLDVYEIDPVNATLIPRSLAERVGAFPIFVVDGVATIAMLDPHDLHSVELIRQATHHEIETVVCEEPSLRKLIKDAYGDAPTTRPNPTPTPAGSARAATTPGTPPTAGYTRNAANQIPGEADEGPAIPPVSLTLDDPDHERALAEAAAREAGLTLITAACRPAATARLHAFSDHPINYKGQASTLKWIAEAIEDTEGPIFVDGLDDDLTRRAAADAALEGRHIIATMTAADALDAIDRLRVAGVTQRTLDAIEIAVFHAATNDRGVHEIVDAAGHPIYRRTPSAHPRTPAHPPITAASSPTIPNSNSRRRSA